MHMNRMIINFSVILFIAFIFVGCAQRVSVDACLDGTPYGFFWGLIHGIIAPFGLIGMLFKDDVTVFATNNNGFWYAFGFLLGSGGWGILAGKSKK